MKPIGWAAIWAGGIWRGIAILLFWIVVAGGLGIMLALLLPRLGARLPTWIP